MGRNPEGKAPQSHEPTTTQATGDGGAQDVAQTDAINVLNDAIQEFIRNAQAGGPPPFSTFDKK